LEPLLLGNVGALDQFPGTVQLPDGPTQLATVFPAPADRASPATPQVIAAARKIAREARKELKRISETSFQIPCRKTFYSDGKWPPMHAKKARKTNGENGPLPAAPSVFPAPSWGVGADYAGP
jgi:hypothetical protein